MRAVVLLSGGVDSTVALALALEKGRECLAISFDYNQKHKIELHSAIAIAEHYRVLHKIIIIDPTTFPQSALLGHENVPKNRSQMQINLAGIPTTYVPARNTLFLAYAMGQAEMFQAEEIYFGPNALDCRPYPDCRPLFVEAFQGVLNCGTKQAVEGQRCKLVTPLIEWDKERIVREGLRLKAPLEMTFSCYDPFKGKACEQCDACILRKAGFEAAHYSNLKN